MKKYKLIITSLIFTVVVLFITRVVVSNTISTSGVELNKINENIFSLHLENSIVSQELFVKESLIAVASEAAKLGLREGQEKFVLTNTLPIAAKQ